VKWSVVAAALGTLALVALGVWQIERREWKLALIDRVERRVHATPVAAPGPAAWSTLTKENSEYLRVTVSGHFIEGRETLVRAVTALGGGFWVMAPLRTDEGFVVLVNRGFVPPEKRDPASRPDSEAGNRVTLTGLLRMTEPKGGFLHTNSPRENRWYSRDVNAIAQAQGLNETAPYFIDAEGGRMPVGGLTVIAFHNSHLLYAITWFTLALMVAVLGVRMALQPAQARPAEPTHA
jgi:surfeit locus 1 family protein